VDERITFVPRLAKVTASRIRQLLALVSGRRVVYDRQNELHLNFLGRMSGIATLTRQFVDAVAGQKPSSLTRAKNRAWPARNR